MNKERIRQFFKKQGSNIGLIILLLLFLIPQTRKPIQVAVNKIFAFSPSELSSKKQKKVAYLDWKLRDLEAQTTNLMQSEGKVVLINLWATWCPPCIAEMPSFQKLFDDYGDRVEFYFISSEENATITRFLDKKQYDFPVYQPVSSIPEQLQSNSLPTTYVISKNGNLTVEEYGTADWNSNKFRKLLDKLLAE